MIFHSLEFLIFFTVLVALYWALPHRWQNLLLLAGSYMFYGWVHPWFLTLIFATTFIDYSSARGMDTWPARKKAFLWLSIITNFGLLGFFKYFNFFVDNVAEVLALAGWHVSRPMLNIVLPVGISFYTFQSMSYTIDVYWNHSKARTSLVDIATFVSFFPHLVAGPIMRATNLLPQVETERRFSAAAARDATLLMVWGFFKKLVIADNVGVIANKVFALKAPEFYVLWAGVFAFCIQIYADFSAYTDIARGTAKWFGFDLIRNFEHPYLATSPTEFWRRWNISLSTWFRDYVYIPLGGSKHGPWQQARNVMITFLLSGLWHGASWNYVIWGAYHGLLLVMTRVADALVPVPARLRRWLVPLQIAGMFVLTNIGWLLFRETEFAALVRNLRLSPFQSSVLGRQTGAYLFFLAVLYSIPLWIQSVWAELGGRDLVAAMITDEARPDFRVATAQALLAGLLFAGVLVLQSVTSLDFIYFQF
jgi:D-alanyl-lipoteichoic acid acyltransferase DltB (MBOAT superfamily)